jgi:hypothetical protein
MNQWRLPTRLELLELYKHKDKLTDLKELDHLNFWSADEAGRDNAWLVDFNNGGVFHTSKNKLRRVRLVRNNGSKLEWSERLENMDWYDAAEASKTDVMLVTGGPSSPFRRMMELSDKVCREEMENIYFVTASRMDNMLKCLEEGSKEIKRLEAENAELKQKLKAIEDFKQKLQDIKEILNEC